MAPRVWVTSPIVSFALQATMLSIETVPLEGVIDTGASQICVDARVAIDLDLAPVNRKPMQMADGSTVEATSYRAVMTVPELQFYDWVEVYGIPMDRPSRRALIGRSFLKRFNVQYAGPEERFYFHEATGSSLGDYEEHDG